MLAFVLKFKLLYRLTCIELYTWKGRKVKHKLRVTNLNPRVSSSNTRIVSSYSQVTSSNLRVTSSNARATSSNPLVKRLKVKAARLKA